MREQLFWAVTWGPAAVDWFPPLSPLSVRITNAKPPEASNQPDSLPHRGAPRSPPPMSPTTMPTLAPLRPLLFFLPLVALILLLSLRFSPSSAGDISPSAPPGSPLIRMRRPYRSYEDYVRHQLNKTLDARLRKVWATRDWDRKVTVFASVFKRLMSEGLLSNASRALCVGARLGQEVAALRQIGVARAVGIDLAPAPPLVLKGDFHSQPFPGASFDFEFSNVFDHALYPKRFASEMERTLRDGGVAVLHVALHRRGDRYSANDLLAIEGLVGLFEKCDVVRHSKVDAFGLDTEVVLRKRSSPQGVAAAMLPEKDATDVDDGDSDGEAPL